MKLLLRLQFFALYFLLSNNVSAQKLNTEFIENDLLKSFKAIEYWNAKSDTDYLQATIANNEFRKTLTFYTNKYPFTIRQKFNTLVKNKVRILDSSDGLVRTYSWENSQTDFDNVIQYRIGQKTKSILFVDTVNKGDEGYVGGFSKLYTLNTNNGTYYLGVYDNIYTRTSYGMGIRTISIKDGKVNINDKIFKTHSGLRNGIYFNYNVFSQSKGRWPTIHYDSKTQTVYIPILTSPKDKLTNKYFRYKFTGQYFEKVK